MRAFDLDELEEAAAVSAAADPAPRLQSKAQFIAGFKPPDFLVDGMLQRRFVYGLTASTGHGKTAVALLISRLVADRKNNNSTLGRHAVDQGHVVYFAGENPDDLRMRVIADDEQSGRDGSDDCISFIPGAFSIDAMFEECNKTGCSIDLVVVDTSAAYFLGTDELSNTQMGGHARALRKLTTLHGGPCVLVLCHPIKHATDPAQLLPRGGGAFIAELDGNLTLWKTDDVLAELWHNKMRGPGFEPMMFRLEKIITTALIDSKGRPIPSVRAVAVSDGDQEAAAKHARSDEDAVLVAMLTPGRSLAALAQACNWTFANGDPAKTRVQRRLAGLAKSGLVRPGRGGSWELTDKGRKAAELAKASAQP
jgi:hypothetical protein